MKGSRQGFIRKVSCLVAVFMVLSGCGKVGINSSNGDDVFLSDINDGIQSTNHVLSNQINQKYVTFEYQYSIDSEKAGPYLEKALALHDEANDVVNYMEALKWDLVQKTEDKKVERAFAEGLLKSIDTIRNGRKVYDINTSKLESREVASYLLERNIISELALKIGHFRDEVIKAIGSEYDHEIGLNIDGNFWNDVFSKKTLTEDVITLNNLIMEVQTVELSAVSQLMTQIHAADFTFDEMGAKVFAESNYILSGQTYYAQALVTAWKNTFATALVSLDGGPQKEYTSDGHGIINLEYNCAVGTHNYKGIIMMRDPKTYEIMEFPFASSFTVVSPSSN